MWTGGVPGGLDTCFKHWHPRTNGLRSETSLNQGWNWFKISVPRPSPKCSSLDIRHLLQDAVIQCYTAIVYSYSIWYQIDCCFEINSGNTNLCLWHPFARSFGSRTMTPEKCMDQPTWWVHWAPFLPGKDPWLLLYPSVPDRESRFTINGWIGDMVSWNTLAWDLVSWDPFHFGMCNWFPEMHFCFRNLDSLPRSSYLQRSLGAHLWASPGVTL